MRSAEDILEATAFLAAHGAALRAAQATDLVTVGDLAVVVGGGPSAPLRQADFLHLITIPE